MLWSSSLAEIIFVYISKETEETPNPVNIRGSMTKFLFTLLLAPLTVSAALLPEALGLFERTKVITYTPVEKNLHLEFGFEEGEIGYYVDTTGQSVSITASHRPIRHRLLPSGLLFRLNPFPRSDHVVQPERLKGILDQDIPLLVYLFLLLFREPWILIHQTLKRIVKTTKRPENEVFGAVTAQSSR